MKLAVLTLGIALSVQTAFGASCESYFRKLNIPAKKIQRTLNCNLTSESNDSTNTIFMNNDQLCVTEYTDVEGATVSSLNFVQRGFNKVSVQVPHKKVSLERDTLKVIDNNHVTRGGILPLFFKKTEISITNNSSIAPTLEVSMTEGLRAGGKVETIFAGNYECRKSNGILDIFGL